MPDSHILIAGCRWPDSAGSGRYSPAVPSRIEAMLETIAERPCDTRFRWDADDDGLPCEAFINSPACECETPCMLPMFSIVSSILKKHCLSASLPPSLPLSFPFLLCHSLSAQRALSTNLPQKQISSFVFFFYYYFFFSGKRFQNQSIDFGASTISQSSMML